MKMKELFEDGRQTLSFEVFPPKKTSSIDTIYQTLDELGDLKPDFISVTYGAGGNPADDKTCKIASIIQDKYKIRSIAHLTCVSTKKENLDEILKQFKDHGIENILALRGDVNPDIPPTKDFEYASDLVSYIKAHGDFNVSGACYPEGHVAATSVVTDVLNLKKKVDAGAEHLLSQLFFDNAYFYDFLDKARMVGIDVPIEAGIMPVTSKSQIERMVSMCGASLPRKFTKMLQRYENNPEALRDAGIAYAIDQIVDLLSNGVNGIHLYTMNNAYVARRITEGVGNLFLHRNDK
jgi:methylenetetrahydrofolate reductase (NADPH)